MTRRFGVTAGVLAGVTAVLAAALAAGAGSAGTDISAPVRIHVIEHAKTDTVIDTGRPGDTSGDLLTFHNPVFGPKDSQRVGSDSGDCIRVSPSHGSWECRWVTHLDGGSITVEGPFFDTHDSVVAVTGGTGLFRNARGAMQLKARAGGTKFDFIFNLIP
jgi:allene oxide cyclase